NGVVEGLNNKIRVVTRRSYGFRTYKAMEIAFNHNLGRLPEPESTHRFCLGGILRLENAGDPLPTSSAQTLSYAKNGALSKFKGRELMVEPLNLASCTK
ncbi:MAG: transposase, partial [Acidobacteriota bacterium]|nr:transposase [Acidobacteriota bacterium]